MCKSLRVDITFDGVCKYNNNRIELCPLPYAYTIKILNYKRSQFIGTSRHIQLNFTDYQIIM